MKTKIQKIFSKPVPLRKQILNTTNEHGYVRIKLDNYTVKYLWIGEVWLPINDSVGRFVYLASDSHQYPKKPWVRGTISDVLVKFSNYIPEEILMRILFHLDELA